MRKFIISSVLMLIISGLFAQGIFNNGAKIAVGTGAYLTIGGTNGNYRNETNITNGSVDLSGIFTLTGNITNNATGTDIVASSNVTSNVILNGTILQTLSGSSTAPFVFSNLIINNVIGVNLSKNVNAVSITIKPNAKLTLNLGYTMAAATVNINSNVTGTGTYIDNGTSNISSAHVQQYLTAGRNWYISSPVTTATSASLNIASSVYSYDESNESWIMESSLLDIMKGYVAVIGTTGNVTFTGNSLNTGVQNSALTRHGATKSGFNLVGNPYPSYLDWSLVSSSSSNLESTMWYRTKTTSNGTYVFDTYNAIGNVGTGNNGTVVTAFIPPMQAFWTRVSLGNAAGLLAMNNSMRSHEDLTSNRLKAPRIADVNQNVLRLQVSNGVNSDEAIVLFNSNAKDGYDSFDSDKMSNNNAAVPEIYTFVGDEKLVINGLNDIATNDEIPLGFSTAEENKFTIKATEIRNFNPETKIILKDKFLNVEHELTDNSAYSFSSQETSSSSRFSIVFRTSSVTTGIDKIDGGESRNESFNIYKNSNGQITINRNNALSDGTVAVSNAVGQVLIIKPTTGAVTVIDAKLIPGVYLVKVTVAGINKTKKVIIN
jgi:hypothetical protein